jgi:carbon starvation protein
MLLEGFVALIALATIMIAIPAPGTPPGAVYGQGIGRFLTVLIGEKHLLLATVFGSMAFSTFVFDTLDVATRLGRYILQELLGWHHRVGAALGTLLTVGVPLLVLFSVPRPAPGRPPAYLYFWTLFGTSNQLLAALTLLGVTVWLKRTKRAWWFTFLPMVFVMAITAWALVRQARDGLSAYFAADGSTNPVAMVNGVVACALLALAAVVAVEALRAWRSLARWGGGGATP